MNWCPLITAAPAGQSPTGPWCRGRGRTDGLPSATALRGGDLLEGFEQLRQELGLAVARPLTCPGLLLLRGGKGVMLVETGPDVRGVDKAGKAVEGADAVVAALVVRKDVELFPGPRNGDVEQSVLLFETLF